MPLSLKNAAPISDSWMKQLVPDRHQPQQEITTVSDAPLRQFMGYHIKRAFNVIQADLTRVLKPFELRMVSYSVLALIVENPGIRQSQLSHALAIERPNLVIVIDELEKRGLIEREKLLSDRRAYLLTATPAGRRLCDKAEKSINAHEAAVFDGVDQEARINLIRSMLRIEANFTEGLK